MCVAAFAPRTNRASSRVPSSQISLSENESDEIHDDIFQRRIVAKRGVKPKEERNGKDERASVDVGASCGIAPHALLLSSSETL